MDVILTRVILGLCTPLWRTVLVLILCAQEHNLPAITTWSYGKVNPVASVLVLFDKEFIEILLNLFRIRFQDIRIINRLLCPTTADIDGTARNMIRGRYTTYFLIQLRATIAAINYNRCTIPVSKHLQPTTNSFHIFNRYMTWDIIHFGMITLCKLPQLEMLGEFHLTVCCYFCHSKFQKCKFINMSISKWLSPTSCTCREYTSLLSSDPRTYLSFLKQ